MLFLVLPQVCLGPELLAAIWAADVLFVVDFEVEQIDFSCGELLVADFAFNGFLLRMMNVEDVAS